MDGTMSLKKIEKMLLKKKKFGGPQTPLLNDPCALTLTFFRIF